MHIKSEGNVNTFKKIVKGSIVVPLLAWHCKKSPYQVGLQVNKNKCLFNFLFNFHGNSVSLFTTIYGDELKYNSVRQIRGHHQYLFVYLSLPKIYQLFEFHNPVGDTRTTTKGRCSGVFIVDLEQVISHMELLLIPTCTQPPFTCSKLTMETTEQCVNQFKVKNKEARTMSITTLNRFRLLFRCFFHY